MSVYIPFNTPSSKNSKRIVRSGNKTMLINSKQVMDYKKKSGSFWMTNKLNFLKEIDGKEKPLKIGFYFIRDSKRKFDFVNLAQLPLDLMQEYGWISDDSMIEVIPQFLGYEVDKEKAGVVIFVL